MNARGFSSYNHVIPQFLEYEEAPRKGASSNRGDVNPGGRDAVILWASIPQSKSMTVIP